MSITLDALSLPEESVWTDEFSWSVVEASTESTIGSKMIVTESSIGGQLGRPITLVGDYAWMDRIDVESLWTMYQELGLEMTLTLNDGRIFNVRFRHWDKPAMTAESVVGTAHPDNTTIYRLTLKLVIV